MNEFEDKEWSDLPDVYVKLKKDKLGYPPVLWEQLKAKATGKVHVYKLMSVPLYARGLAYHNEVRICTSDDGYYPVVESIICRSGYSTVRLWLNDKNDKDLIIDYFTKYHCLLEFKEQLVAIAIPSDAFDEIYDFICDEKDRGRWDAEDGYLKIDESISYDNLSSRST